MIFSFTRHKEWIEGKVAREQELVCCGDRLNKEPEYQERWVARSARFPGYYCSAQTITSATEGFREGLDDWLRNNPDQRLPPQQKETPDE